MLFDKNKLRLPDAEDALEGRKTPIAVPDRHFVHRRQILPPFPDLLERAVFGMGCFWGAEKAFWPLPGVYTTAVGYSGGLTPNPTYKEVCTGKTGHAEVVLVVFDPGQVTYEELLKVFFEQHDPTQGMRQGNDVGTQYRSLILTHSAGQDRVAAVVRDAYQAALSAVGYDRITTEIRPAGPFYYAEESHQQYLARNPGGYCGHGGIGVACPVGAAVRVHRLTGRGPTL